MAGFDNKADNTAGYSAQTGYDHKIVNTARYSAQNGTMTFSPVAARCYIDLREGEKLKALPGFHLINGAVISLKSSVHDGQRGFGCAKASCYLGYRVVTYIGLPLGLNLISLVFSLALTIITLPRFFCSDSLNRWCWVHLQGSLAFTMQSLYDLTSDLRLLSRCCRADKSLYSAI